MLIKDEHGLPRTSPEQQGISSAGIRRVVEALERQIHEIHSVMLLRHGNVVAEGWWSPYGREYPHQLFSLSKSFTGTAVGFALTEGRFSIDDPVLSFFPDETPAEVSDLLAAMTVRHLLTMSTGQATDMWFSMLDRPDSNWVKGFFEMPVLNQPGSQFVYNNGASYMLSAIVQRTTGMTVLDYLQPRLFEPLGIENATWEASPQGITAGGIGLSLKTEDVARFGQLYLQKGMWQGKQLLPEAWVEAATATQIATKGIEIDWSQGYGYQFWRSRHNTYRGDGVFGQWCIVMPEQDAVLAITSGTDIFNSQQPLNLVWEMLLPIMSPDSLPEDTDAQDALAEKLSSLSFTPVQGQTSSLLATQVSGQTYAVDANELGIETITLNFTEAGCIVSVTTSAGDETIPCGYGTWQRSPKATTLFHQALLFDRTPVAASGAWTADETFTMILRLYETPFFHTVDCHFVGDELLIETRINVSLESMEPLLLTAHSVKAFA